MHASKEEKLFRCVRWASNNFVGINNTHFSDLVRLENINVDWLQICFNVNKNKRWASND